MAGLHRHLLKSAKVRARAVALRAETQTSASWEKVFTSTSGRLLSRSAHVHTGPALHVGHRSAQHFVDERRHIAFT